MERAANRLEDLQRANKNTLADLALAVSERTPHDYGMLKGEVEHLKRELTESIRERNETVSDLIKQRDVAMLLAALAGRESESWEAKLSAIWAIEQADILIAAAKEAK